MAFCGLVSLEHHNLLQVFFLKFKLISFSGGKQMAQIDPETYKYNNYTKQDKSAQHNILTQRNIAFSQILIRN